MPDRVPVSPKGRHMVEAIIGPCSRAECEAAILVVQEALDERLPELAAATMGTFDVSDEPSRVVELEAQVAELERERDEAVASLDQAVLLGNDLGGEVAELTEALVKIAGGPLPHSAVDVRAIARAALERGVS